MQSIHLNVQDSVYEQFLGFLEKFQNNEVVIIKEKKIIVENDSNFLSDKIEMNRIYDRYKSGNSKKYTQEEFELILNAE